MCLQTPRAGQLGKSQNDSIQARDRQKWGFSPHTHINITHVSVVKQKLTSVKLLLFKLLKLKLLGNSEDPEIYHQLVIRSPPMSQYLTASFPASIKSIHPTDMLPCKSTITQLSVHFSH